jgi:hypothetical protein
MDFTTLSLADLLAVDFSEFDAETLEAYKSELASRFTASKEALSGTTPTRAQAEEVRSLHARHGEIATRLDELAAEEAISDEDAEALEALSIDPPEDEGDEGDEGDGADADADAGDDEGDEGDEGADAGGDEGAAEAGVDDKVETKTKKTTTTKVKGRPANRATARIALAGRRPEIPEVQLPEEMLSITAAADTGLSAGSSVTLAQVDAAWFAKSKGFPRPQGDGSTEDIRTYPLAQVAYDVAPEFVIDESMSTQAIHEVFQAATDESRLEGESLVASAGWCAPSEIMYNLPGQEVVDGMYSTPEVQVNRGGFKHTTGIAWGTLMSSVGFTQTESQAIAGTSKPCYEVPCPTFVEARLDAIGLCIKVPILLETGYPEMVSNVTSRALQVHQVRQNAYKLSKADAAKSGTRDFSTVDLGTAANDTLAGVNLVLMGLRQKYRLGVNATLEVVFPTYAREVFREDLSLRTGRDLQAVTDAMIDAEFNVRKAAVQYVYDWTDLADTTAVAYPSTIPFLAYPSGTVVTGAANVISLSSVYDAASLAVNTYTGLFAEQGILVEKMNYEIVKGTVPVCMAGRTGAANLTCS